VGLAIGAVTAYSAQYALMLAVVGVALATILRTWERVTYTALFVCLAVPLGGGFTQVAHLDIHAGGVSMALPLLLPWIVLIATLVSLQWLVGWPALWRGSPAYASFWVALLGALCVAALIGAGTNGLRSALRDAEYLLLYSWPLAILPFSRLARRVMVPRIVGVIVTAAVMCSVVDIGVFAIPGLRERVFGQTIWAGSTRVGFGNMSMLNLALPLLIALLVRHMIPRRWRGLGWLGALAMVAALALALERSSIAAIFFTFLLMTLYPLLRRAPWNAGMILRGIVAIAFVAVLIGGALYLSGSSRVQAAVSAIPSRVASLTSPTKDAAWQTRAQTNKAAWAQWGESDQTRVVGLGMGSNLGLYTPSGQEASTGSFVDNVWATAAVKGGLILVVALAGYLVACWGVFARAWRRATDEFERTVWLTCTLAFPGFLFETTYVTAHLLFTPSVVVGFTTLATVAALAKPKQVHSGA